MADKGAPGVTTSCLVLALGWPRPVLLAECDPAGADLPWRVNGTSGPLVQGVGMVSLATSSRGVAGGHRRVWDHVQRLDGGLSVLVGPQAPEQAEAMGGAWGTIADLLAGVTDPDETAGTGVAGEVDVVADCGRLLSRSSPAAAVLQRADLVVLVTRPTVSGVAHARHGLGVAARVLNDAPRAGSGLDRLAVLVVDDPRSPGSRKVQQREVGEVLDGTPGLQDVPVVGVLAHDPRAAAALAGLSPSGRGLDRSPLLLTARSAAATLAARAQSLTATTQVRS
ncbi:hypothetical protein [Aquipuribacter hungaricus]|uniref:MinD/ParA family protein n=1 Tax=Aquipuribacter hungaricus TaxID=545624 RepID=A0ABV7WKZ9_9MICO